MAESPETLNDTVKRLLKEATDSMSSCDLAKSAAVCKKVLALDPLNGTAKSILNKLDDSSQIYSLLYNAFKTSNDIEQRAKCLRHILAQSLEFEQIESLLVACKDSNEYALITNSKVASSNLQSFLDMPTGEFYHYGLLEVITRNLIKADQVQLVYNKLLDILSDAEESKVIANILLEMQNRYPNTVLENRELVSQCIKRLCKDDAFILVFHNMMSTLNEKQYKSLCSLFTLQLISIPCDEQLGLIFLENCFKIEPNLGRMLLSEPNVFPVIVDSIEFESTPIKTKFLELLNQSCQDKACRQLIVANCVEFLKKIERKQDEDEKLQLLARIVLTKLVVGNQITDVKLDEYYVFFKDKLKHKDLAQLAVEGLSYISGIGSLKDKLANDNELVAVLCETEASGPLLYGILHTFHNLMSYRKPLTEEQKKMIELKKFAKDISDSLLKEYNDSSNNDSAVESRIHKLMKSKGILQVFARPACLATDSSKEIVLKCLLNIATFPKYRGDIVSKISLRTLLTKCFSYKTPTSQQKTIQLTTAHLLSKILVTTDPVVLFTKNDFSLDLVQPLLYLCQEAEHELQEYEALLALTNLSSLNEELQHKIVDLKGLSILQSSQFSTNELIQIAATECLSNLMANERVLYYYLNDESFEKLKVFIALMNFDSDAEDHVSERLAIATTGALATIFSCIGEDLGKKLSAYFVHHNGLLHIQCLISAFGDRVPLMHRLLVILQSVSKFHSISQIKPLLKLQLPPELATIQAHLINS